MTCENLQGKLAIDRGGAPGPGPAIAAAASQNAVARRFEGDFTTIGNRKELSEAAADASDQILDRFRRWYPSGPIARPATLRASGRTFEGPQPKRAVGGLQVIRDFMNQSSGEDIESPSSTDSRPWTACRKIAHLHEVRRTDSLE